MKLNSIVFLCACIGCYQVVLGQNSSKTIDNKKLSILKNEAQVYPIKSIYQSQLQIWCDALIDLQVKGGKDDGGILSKSHQFVHGRCGDAVYPFLTLYKLTGDEKYRTAARKVFYWSETHVSQPDGSWTNEPGGKNNWKGITCFSTIVMQSYTHNGLLYGGAALFSRAIPASTHHTFTRAKGLAAALDAGIAEDITSSLPNDTAYGVREWPEASVIQLALGPWRASVTTNDIASSPKRGGHPMGGALSMLWHSQTGPLAVASMNDYVMYEKSNMQQPTNDSEQVCLTPRIELTKDGNRYSNLYDSKAQLTWAKKGDTIQVKIKGNLRNINGDVLPGECESARKTVYKK